MPPTAQELSLLINPLVPDAVAHNKRVSSHSLLCVVLSRKKNKSKANESAFLSLTDTLLPPLAHRIPPRSLRRDPRSAIRARLRVLLHRHALRVPALPRVSSRVRRLFVFVFFFIIDVVAEWCGRVFPWERRDRGGREKGGVEGCVA